MADISSPITPPTTADEAGFPLAAILCIAIGGYVVIVVVLLLIRQALLQKGLCRDNCACCGKEGEPCCECCLSCAESCNCCKSPNLNACLDSICPARKRLDCIDIIMCECCSNQDGGCCGSQEPLCDCCNQCCQSQCADCECSTLHCCCFEISLKGGSPPGGGAPPEHYPGYPPYPGGPVYAGGLPVDGAPQAHHQLGAPSVPPYHTGPYPGPSQAGMFAARPPPMPPQPRTAAPY